MSTNWCQMSTNWCQMSTKISLGFIHSLFHEPFEYYLFQIFRKYRSIKDLVEIPFLFISVIYFYPWVGVVRLISFFYLSVNGMLVTIGTKFIWFQSNRCIASIFPSRISRNPRESFINTILGTTSALQSNCYSYISALGHKLILDIGSTLLFDLKKREKGIEVDRRRSHDKTFESKKMIDQEFLVLLTKLNVERTFGSIFLLWFYPPPFHLQT